MITFAIDQKVLNKLPKYIQQYVTFAEHDEWGKYHIVVYHPKFKEASFHDTNLRELIWEIKQFIENGDRY